MSNSSNSDLLHKFGTSVAKNNVQDSQNGMAGAPNSDSAQFVLLSDEQIDTIVSAIENTPAASVDGKTSELTTLAVLYIISADEKTDKNLYLDELAATQNTGQLRTDLSAFVAIMDDFVNDTNEMLDDPAVLQTRRRMQLVVDSMHTQLAHLMKNNFTTSANHETGASDNLGLPSTKIANTLDETLAQSGHNDNKDNCCSGEKSIDFFNSPWLSFVGFALSCVLLLLAVIALVRWLQKSNAEKDGKADDAETSKKLIVPTSNEISSSDDVTKPDTNTLIV